MRALAAVVTLLLALPLSACSSDSSACTGSFDGELIPGAEGEPSKIAAAEAWASTSDAPDDGWTETADGAVSGDWVLTIAETDGGEWAVVAQRCA